MLVRADLSQARRAAVPRRADSCRGWLLPACACFRPWRLQSLAFKALRQLAAGLSLWRDFAYEYEFDRLAIDLINGSPLLREWVDDPAATPADLDALSRS
jgi:hypothetical protein